MYLEKRYAEIQKEIYLRGIIKGDILNIKFNKDFYLKRNFYKDWIANAY